MKKNHEKLTDAIGMLNQETIHGCITDISYSGRKANRKRVVAVLAACMAMLLMLGVVIAAPMMRKEDPIVHGEVLHLIIIGLGSEVAMALDEGIDPVFDFF